MSDHERRAAARRARPSGRRERADRVERMLAWRLAVAVRGRAAVAVTPLTSTWPPAAPDRRHAAYDPDRRGEHEPDLGRRG